MRTAVEEVRPALGLSFEQAYSFGKEHVKIRYGFVTARYASNFGLIVPSRLPYTIGASKARLLDLEMLRESDQLVKPSVFELILGTPSLDDPKLSSITVRRIIENIELIEAHGDAEGIPVVRMNTVQEAAKYLLSKAAA